MSRFPQLKLTYFDSPGRAEAIRLALHIGGIPFIDERLSFEQFFQRKSSLLFGQVPVLEVDGQVIAQSDGILRYAGKLAGLYPVNDPLAALKIDEVLAGWNELMVTFTPTYMEQDEAKKKAMRLVLAEKTIPHYLRCLEARVANTQRDIAFQQSSQIFIHELVIYQLLRMLSSGFLEYIPTDIADGYALLKATEAKVLAHPKVQHWNALQAARNHRYKLTYFDTPGRAEGTRIAFVIGGIPFEDERIDRAELAKRRDTLPFGQLPVLQVDDEVISQSVPILRYVGALAGLYPTTDPLQALRVDEVMGWMEDMDAVLEPVFRDQDAEQRVHVCKSIVETTLPKVLESMEKRIAHWGGQCAVGPAMTIADLVLYGYTVMFKTSAAMGFPPNLLDAFPNILRMYTQVREHPKAKDVEWLAQF